ncbi:LPS export ABC transporter periplasmic protein LptC [Alistipes sp.]|uniref:LPS export ABC transporter periplasmic protein LptC n=1 Tax=Alistipes sp. TaxID=1872444 RepID=UPI00307C0AF1
MTRTIRVALSVMGSAILLFSCADKDTGRASASEETMMTEYSEDLSVVMSQNGRRSYHFVTPLLEGYSLAREPYREFRKGVKITTYQNDSLATVDAVLTANYAIYYENRELWEAKGNVVVEKSDGKTLYTQQLFWNARTKKIYSNVDSKIVQNNGRDVFIGEGFESDEEFKDWRFRRMKGRMEVEMKQSADSTAADSTAVRPVPKPSDSRPAVQASESGKAAAATAPAREIPAGTAERQAERPEAEVERRPLKMLDDSRAEARPVPREEAVSTELKLKN